MEVSAFSECFLYFNCSLSLCVRVCVWVCVCVFVCVCVCCPVFGGDVLVLKNQIFLLGDCVGPGCSTTKCLLFMMVKVVGYSDAIKIKF